MMSYSDSKTLLQHLNGTIGSSLLESDIPKAEMSGLSRDHQGTDCLKRPSVCTVNVP